MYPSSEPYDQQYFAVGDGHDLYLEQSGNPQGIPVVYLHGGPGSGCADWYRQFFDPKKYRVIMFDQRGAGKSTPKASLENNTTQHLIADIEKIRQHLNVVAWMVFGGSWGSTLALAYAQTHPQAVTSLVLRGIFLCRDQDIKWFYQSGTGRVFPEFWQDFIAPIAAEKRADMIKAYYEVLTGDDQRKQLEAARAWSVWEGRTINLIPDMQHAENFNAAEFALAFARIECHYFINQGFMRPEQLLQDIGVMQHIPGIIVHGRYDMVCPVEQAYALASVWPNAELRIIADAGHSIAEAGITQALLDATDQFAERLS